MLVGVVGVVVPFIEPGFFFSYGSIPVTDAGQGGDAGNDNLFFDFTVPFSPGTQVRAANDFFYITYDSNGLPGGCQMMFAMIKNSTDANPTCKNMTMPVVNQVLDVQGVVDGGPMSQNGFINQCDNVSIKPLNGTPPFTLTVSPPNHPPYNITSFTTDPIVWTVSLSRAMPFFLSLVSAEGLIWANGPMGVGRSDDDTCLAPDTMSRSKARTVAAGAGAGGLFGGLFLIGIALIVKRCWSRAEKPRLRHYPPVTPWYASSELHSSMEGSIINHGSSPQRTFSTSQVYIGYQDGRRSTSANMNGALTDLVELPPSYVVALKILRGGVGRLTPIVNERWRGNPGMNMTHPLGFLRIDQFCALTSFGVIEEDKTIATYFIWDISVTNYCPDQWQARHFWQNRMVYTALRDAQEVERFMRICPQWGAAAVSVETHMFWMHVIALVDPHDTLGAQVWVRNNNNSSAPPVKSNPYQHYRTVIRYSCFVCRINTPNTIHGLGNGKRMIATPWLSYCTLCRDHDKPRAAFCGLCLREAQSYEVELQINPTFHVGCIENEDHELWPNVQATCRSCRAEWLWRKACAANVRDAIGGRRFRIDDWEAKSTLDGFIDLSEGRIADVILVARERHWIRTHTKLADMLSQALAASRFEGREERLTAAAAGEDTEMDLSDEDEEEEDLELAQLTEDSGIREIALNDWARNRILDGFWISPADQWYNHVQSDLPWDVRAIHPCPWTVESDTTIEEHQGESEQGVRIIEEVHPKVSTVRGPIPPSHPLCEQTFNAHQKQMRILLLPAMKNIVRRIVIESSADAADPAIRAARMTLEDVVKELQDEASWFDGVDWLERRLNARRDSAAREEATSDDHSTSSGSSRSSDESSVAISPVLSTTTLQTTPSPPPIEEKNTSAVLKNVARAVTIAVSPVLDPPRLIHPIPHVPVMAAHLPHFSLEAFRMASFISILIRLNKLIVSASQVWREACSPLYHCRCKICERAQAAASEAAAVAAGVTNRNQAPANDQVDTAQEVYKKVDVVEIRLDDADGEGEQEIDYLEYEDDDDVFDSDEIDSRYDSRSRSRSPPRLNRPVYTPSTPVSPRKRSCDEIDNGRLCGDEPDVNSDVDDMTPIRPGQPGTPPKRLRREGPPVLKGLPVDDPVQRMLHKRSSEGVDTRDVQIQSKRAKMSEEAESPPTSLTAEDSEHSSADADPEEVEEYTGARKLPVVER
ncbi:hypothetical protein J3R30DRAFT_3685774 [Lentinula aciculospora]|uniref:Uncharacterized protein n=1 Tax=Lentinula aciculospora TaxID=153920 RepID=A0A9W9A081_9AGAR|nr:hypothetical protein J3R30DRAFT_3685774 [Lentinula aciculospora]